jgi:hypothetical protein
MGYWAGSFFDAFFSTFPATRQFEFKGITCSRTQFPLRLVLNLWGPQERHVESRNWLILWEGNKFPIYMYMYSVPAEYYCHYTVATQLTAEGSADDLHGSPLCSACMNDHVTCRSIVGVCNYGPQESRVDSFQGCFKPESEGALPGPFFCSCITG